MSWTLIPILILIYESPHQSLILLRSWRSSWRPKAWIGLPHFEQGGIWTGTTLRPPQRTWKNYWFYTSKSQQMFRRVAQCIKRKRERHQPMYCTFRYLLIWYDFHSSIYMLLSKASFISVFPRKLNPWSWRWKHSALQAELQRTHTNTHKRENIVYPPAVYYWQ